MEGNWARKSWNVHVRLLAVHAVTSPKTLSSQERSCAIMGLRKCASVPSLSSTESPQQLEIYCGKRPLVELSQKVPPRWHGIMQDIGVSHYYVVV